MPMSYSSSLRELVSDMLIRDPKKRPGCDEILKRPFIQAVVQSMMKDQEREGGELSADVGTGVSGLGRITQDPISPC